MNSRARSRRASASSGGSETPAAAADEAAVSSLLHAASRSPMAARHRPAPSSAVPNAVATTRSVLRALTVSTAAAALSTERKVLAGAAREAGLGERGRLDGETACFGDPCRGGEFDRPLPLSPRVEVAFPSDDRGRPRRGGGERCGDPDRWLRGFCCADGGSGHSPTPLPFVSASSRACAARKSCNAFS
eukprot:scaffold108934_cov26-Tisochrysis_lutea.AAC.3